LPAGASRCNCWLIPAGDSHVQDIRHSALTFNGHRIHYDRPYCREEGYRGLVVHGPLLATWLLDLLRRAMPAAGLRRFNFRALRPAFEGVPITLAGRPTAGGAALWAETEGALAMEADAELERDVSSGPYTDW
jgi:3-methylfumaryl-CoA hydratase